MPVLAHFSIKDIKNCNKIKVLMIHLIIMLLYKKMKMMFKYMTYI